MSYIEISHRKIVQGMQEQIPAFPIFLYLFICKHSSYYPLTHMCGKIRINPFGLSNQTENYAWHID